jgi:hypothetical protein
MTVIPGQVIHPPIAGFNARLIGRLNLLRFTGKKLGLPRLKQRPVVALFNTDEVA